MYESQFVSLYHFTTCVQCAVDCIGGFVETGEKDIHSQYNSERNSVVKLDLSWKHHVNFFLHILNQYEKIVKFL